MNVISKLNLDSWNSYQYWLIKYIFQLYICLIMHEQEQFLQITGDGSLEAFLKLPLATFWTSCCVWEIQKY
jgi:hypothetical protein